jgi:hypothetical protein
MQLDETRARNAINWRNYSREFFSKKDEYGTFFSAWVALVILARDYEASYCSHLPPARGDEQPLSCCFENAKEIVLSAIRKPELASNRSRLSQRHNGSILRPERRGSNDKVLRSLSAIWNGRQVSEASELEGVKTLLLRVRNGLFHGSKMYNDDFMDRETDDRQLLADLNPLLLSIVDGILGQPGPHRRFM